MVWRIGAFLCVLTLVCACNNNKVKGRYISETDTAFSKDIRDVSAKINKDPNNPELYYLRGNSFFYQDKFKDALLDFETAIQLDSNKAMYEFRAGETMLKLDTADSKRTRMHLQRAIRLAPDLLDARLTYARLLIARQEYGDAEKELRQLTNKVDVADKAMLYLGICRKEQKDTTQALTFFDKSLQLNPQNYDAAMQLALLKSALNDKTALDWFDRVLAINEYSDEAFYGKGLMLQKQQQYKDALAYYERAYTIRPEHKMAKYNSAVIYSLFEDWEKTEEWCNKVLDLDPKFANALALRGLAEENTGRKKAAIEDYKAALDADPNNLPAKNGLKANGVQ